MTLQANIYSLSFLALYTLPQLPYPTTSPIYILYEPIRSIRSSMIASSLSFPFLFIRYFILSRISFAFFYSFIQRLINIQSHRCQQQRSRFKVIQIVKGKIVCQRLYRKIYVSISCFYYQFVFLQINSKKMKKIHLGILLILMMFGHNFVLNQTQTMQKELTSIHSISITEFNLLYSIPSAVSILFIIPMGFFYQKYANALLWAGAIVLSLGQLLVTIFGSENKDNYYHLLMGGRVFQGIGAEILYMIQGNMASSWMGKFAGVVFILPQVGQILNVFVTPLTFKSWGVRWSFFVGFLACFISSISCILIYYGLQKQKLKKSPSKQNIHMIQSQTDQQQPTNPDSNQQSTTESAIDQMPQYHKPNNIFQAGRIFWLVILLCGINECLYFPFLDNANQLIINRFCIPFEKTGYYLSIPFVAAMLTSALSSKILTLMQRKKLIFLVSFIPLIGHSIIFFDEDCQTEPTFIGELTLIIGFTFFGMGIGSYYSVSFPAVGLSVPQEIRGMAYACMGFFQTISMTLIPIFAGQIIESEQKITKLSEGYKQQSLLFVGICFVGVVVSFIIFNLSTDTSYMYNDQQQIDDQLNQQNEQQMNSV